MEVDAEFSDTEYYDSEDSNVSLYQQDSTDEIFTKYPCFVKESKALVYCIKCFDALLPKDFEEHFEIEHPHESFRCLWCCDSKIKALKQSKLFVQHQWDCLSRKIELEKDIDRAMMADANEYAIQYLNLVEECTIQIPCIVCNRNFYPKNYLRHVETSHAMFKDVYFCWWCGMQVKDSCAVLSTCDPRQKSQHLLECFNTIQKQLSDKSKEFDPKLLTEYWRLQKNCNDVKLPCILCIEKVNPCSFFPKDYEEHMTKVHSNVKDLMFCWWCSLQMDKTYAALSADEKIQHRIHCLKTAIQMMKDIDYNELNEYVNWVIYNLGDDIKLPCSVCGVLLSPKNHEKHLSIAHVNEGRMCAWCGMKDDKDWKFDRKMRHVRYCLDRKVPESKRYRNRYLKKNLYYCHRCGIKRTDERLLHWDVWHKVIHSSYCRKRKLQTLIEIKQEKQREEQHPSVTRRRKRIVETTELRRSPRNLAKQTKRQ